MSVVEPRRPEPRTHWVVAFLVRAAVNVAAVWAAVRVLGGVHSDGEVSTYVIAGVVLAAVNSLVRPVITILAIPLIVVTLGIAYLLVGVAMFALTAWLIPGLTVDGFWSAVGGAIIIWLVNWALSSLLDLEGGRRRPTRRGDR
jgi:putative membrane protein